MRKLELLSPAKNADVAIAAINNGADAVYIGGPAFGARQAVAILWKRSNGWFGTLIVSIAGCS